MPHLSRLIYAWFICIAYGKTSGQPGYLRPRSEARIHRYQLAVSNSICDYVTVCLYRMMSEKRLNHKNITKTSSEAPPGESSQNARYIQRVDPDIVYRYIDKLFDLCDCNV